jgi:aminoglycoside phosphotransferase (APT) family kinase protein
MIKKNAITEYLNNTFGEAELIEFNVLGAGTHGAGFSLTFKTPEATKEYVIKNLEPHGLGHDYPSDRAGTFLLALEEYKNIPHHIKAIDVISLMPDGTITSIGGGKEFYLIMERASGTNYFEDLGSFRKKPALDEKDKAKIRTLAEYLAKIHSVKKESKCLYWRKLRDTIGHGECLMGVFDSYPEGTMDFTAMAEIEKKCVDWRAKLKNFHHRLSQIHGDFHPGNIWFKGDTFTLLDRSRGPWGDPADDVTAMTINYIFYSIKFLGKIAGPYLEGFNLFFNTYIELTGDAELLKVCGLFFAFRGAVIANPVFYPEVTPEQRKLIFLFVHNILDEESLDIDSINNYLLGS